MPEQERTGDATGGRSDGVEERDRERPRLHREDLARGQIRRAGTGRGEEEGHADEGDEDPLRVRASQEERDEDATGRGRPQVTERDHDLATDGVEEPSEHERPGEVPCGEDHEEDRYRSGCDAEVGRQDRPEVERDRVVQERLADEEREAEDRPFRIAAEGHLRDLTKRDRLTRMDGDRLLRLAQLLAGLLPDLLLDGVDDGLGLVLAAVDEEPARTLGHVAPNHEDRQAEHGAAPEREPPADVLREQVGVEEQQCGDGAERGAEPVAAVDHQVDSPANARGDQLVDRRVDRGVLAPDTGPREEAREVEVPGGERERRRDRRDDVQAECQEEQPLATEPVGELSEEQGAGARPRHVDRRRGSDAAGAQGDAASRLGEPGGDASDDRDLEAVEHPDGSESQDDHPVESRPRQAIHPRRDVRLDGSEFGCHDRLDIQVRRNRNTSGDDLDPVAIVRACWPAACSGTATASGRTEARCGGSAREPAEPATRRSIRPRRRRLATRAPSMSRIATSSERARR